MLIKDETGESRLLSLLRELGTHNHEPFPFCLSHVRDAIEDTVKERRTSARRA